MYPSHACHLFFVKGLRSTSSSLPLWSSRSLGSWGCCFFQAIYPRSLATGTHVWAVIFIFLKVFFVGFIVEGGFFVRCFSSWWERKFWRLSLFFAVFGLSFWGINECGWLFATILRVCKTRETGILKRITEVTNKPIERETKLQVILHLGGFRVVGRRISCPVASWVPAIRTCTLLEI